jgi:hypothetical protein
LAYISTYHKVGLVGIGSLVTAEEEEEDEEEKLIVKWRKTNLVEV